MVKLILWFKIKWKLFQLKGGEDRSATSFKTYVANYAPEHAYRFSKRGYRKDGDFTNLPLYLVRKTKNLL